MPRLWLTCWTLAALLAGPAIAQDKPAAKAVAPKTKGKPDLVAGYEQRTIEGFTVFLNRQALAEADAAKAKYELPPLDVLENELSV